MFARSDILTRSISVGFPLPFISRTLYRCAIFSVSLFPSLKLDRGRGTFGRRRLRDDARPKLIGYANLPRSAWSDLLACDKSIGQPAMNTRRIHAQNLCRLSNGNKLSAYFVLRSHPRSPSRMTRSIRMHRSPPRPRKILRRPPPRRPS